MRGGLIVEGGSPDILGDIAKPGITLAIWKRKRPTELADWLEGLPRELLPEGRFVAAVGQVRPAVASLCDLVGLRDPRRDGLIDDIVALAARFSAVTRSDRIDVRLEVVDHDSCWRFHRDHVGFRLNATYRGPGTQWPPLEQARRAALAQRRYRGPLNEVAAFSVALFKGVTLAGKRALLHRSPPVAGRGVSRLFLCINEELAD